MNRRSWIKGALGGVMALALLGCDENRHDYDDDIPDGYGALVVENNSGSDFDVYVEGYAVGRVDAGDYLEEEYEPGVLGVFLRQRHGDHKGYRDDVDILEGRRSILRIYDEFGDWGDFKITVEYD